MFVIRDRRGVSHPVEPNARTAAIEYLQCRAQLPSLFFPSRPMLTMRCHQIRPSRAAAPILRAATNSIRNPQSPIRNVRRDMLL
jgi:hypothetical protein